jgi:hypothetical protein
VARSDDAAPPAFAHLADQMQLPFEQYIALAQILPHLRHFELARPLVLRRRTTATSIP